MYEGLFRQLDIVVLHVFETMLGLVCEPVSGCPSTGASPQPGLTASVSYTGSVNGECILRLSLPAAAQAASLFLDVPSPAAQLCLDAAAELCNLVAGTLKLQLTGTRQECALSTPRVSCTRQARPLRQYVLCREYGMAGHPLEVELYLD